MFRESFLPPTCNLVWEQELAQAETAQPVVVRQQTWVVLEGQGALVVPVVRPDQEHRSRHLYLLDI